MITPNADWNLIPKHMQPGLRAYMEERRRPGEFLMSLLCNDLIGASIRADDINKFRLYDYSIFLINYCDSRSYGSRSNVDKWLRGIEGV